MSEKSEVLKKIEAEMDEYDAWEERKSKVQKTRILVDEYKLTNELDRIKKAEAEVEQVSSINVGILTEEDIKKVQERTENSLRGAKNGMTFLNESFDRVVPAYSGNLILVASRTGGGKSSTTANLIYSTIKQVNPVTGKHRKVLVISCEESVQSVYTRLTCLYKGWNFNNQQDFTEEQKQEIVDFVPKWAKSGITILGEDGSGLTKSYEGIQSIFKNLIDNNIHYDLILLDYIQKVNQSKKYPNKKTHEVMRDTAMYLDTVKEIYPGVIVMFSQLSPQNEEGTKNFEERLRGCHDILTPATCGIELEADYKSCISRFIIHKNRYNGTTVGSCISNFFDKGHYVPLTEELKNKARLLKEQKEKQKEFGNIFDKKEKENEETND